MALFADSFLKVTIFITTLSNKSLTLKLGAIHCQERSWLIIHQMKSLKENWIASIKQPKQKCSRYYCNLRKSYFGFVNLNSGYLFFQKMNFAFLIFVCTSFTLTMIRKSTLNKFLYAEIAIL